MLTVHHYSLPGAELIRLLVGPNRREFTIHRSLLCASSSFFRYSLESVASEPSSPNSPGTPSSIESDSSAGSNTRSEKLLWLSEESPEMIELFVTWLYQRNSFRATLDEMVAAVTAAPNQATQAKTLHNRRQLHWSLVKLHLFAAAIRLPALQDAAMDAVQDLYLRCDWDISLNFLKFLYEDCAREPAFRLRKWAVAMLAWTLANGSTDPRPFHALFDACPELRADFDQHADKMDGSRADLCLKNPQLRLPRNRLKNDERQFGFRQCSFHSHRSTVGEGRCPCAPDHGPRSPVEEGFQRPGHQHVPQIKVPVARSAPRHRHARMQSGVSQIWTVQESAEEL